MKTISDLKKSLDFNGSAQSLRELEANTRSFRLGGLGGAVCETLASTCPVPVMRVGVEDKFGKSGKVPVLLEEYGLTVDNIVAKAKAAVAMKK
jgi:transketolase